MSIAFFRSAETVSISEISAFKENVGFSPDWGCNQRRFLFPGAIFNHGYF